MTTDDLARLVKHEFDELDKKVAKKADMDEKFKQVDEKFKQVDNRFGNIEAHLAMLSRDVGEIRQNFVYRYELEDALARIEALEKKLKNS